MLFILLIILSLRGLNITCSESNIIDICFVASKGFVIHQRLVELVLCVRSLLEQFENQISETKEEWHSISIKSC